MGTYAEAGTACAEPTRSRSWHGSRSVRWRGRCQLPDAAKRLAPRYGPVEMLSQCRCCWFPSASVLASLIDCRPARETPGYGC